MKKTVVIYSHRPMANNNAPLRRPMGLGPRVHFARNIHPPTENENNHTVSYPVVIPLPASRQRNIGLFFTVSPYTQTCDRIRTNTLARTR